MNIQKLVLATHNKGKIKELKKLLEPYGIEILGANDIKFSEPEETGKTFAENATIKAINACKATSLPALADDSGLCVDALNGAPGVYTSSYGGYQKLLQELSSQNTHINNRHAKFVCTLALAIPNTEKVELFTGEVKGFILTEPRGSHGFAYDPIFLPEGEQLSFAEMLPHQKASISHRGRAINKFLHFLKTGSND